MRRLLGCVCLCLLVGGAVLAQTKIKSYSSYEDYCADNPHAPTCTNGKPLKVQPLTVPAYKVHAIDLSHTTGNVGEYCRKHPNSATCADYCRKNPNAAACKDLSPANGQQPQPQSANTQAAPHNFPGSRASRSRIGSSSIIEIQTQPTAAQLAAVKTLGLHADWRFADPHPDMLMGINAAAVRQSATLRSLLVQLAPALQLTADDVDSELAQANDIDEFWISMRAGESSMMLQGPHMIAPAGPNSLNNGMVAYGVSRNAVLVGHPTAAAAAVQRLRSAGATSAAALQMKAQGADNDLWVMGTRAMLNKAKMPLSIVDDDLTSYLFGLSIRNGLKAELKLNYATAAAARRALTSLRDNPPPPEWPVHVSEEMLGTSVRLKVVVEPAEISKAVDKALATPAAKPFLELLARSVQRSGEVVIYGPDGPKTIHATPTAAPPPGKLVIYGLPSGPKVM